MGDLSELFKLSAAERVQLAQDLWDSVAAESGELPVLSQEQKNEIERRLAEHSRNPTTTANWDDVRARLWSRIG